MPRGLRGNISKGLRQKDFLVKRDKDLLRQGALIRRIGPVPGWDEGVYTAQDLHAEEGPEPGRRGLDHEEGPEPRRRGRDWEEGSGPRRRGLDLGGGPGSGRRGLDPGGGV